MFNYVPIRFILFALCTVTLSSGPSLAQVTLNPPSEHGTCAVLDLTSSDMAFSVDSLATLTDASRAWDGSKPACKVRLPRPDILVVAVGLADTGGGPLRWNALDEAFRHPPTLRICANMELANSASLWAKLSFGR